MQEKQNYFFFTLPFNPDHHKVRTKRKKKQNKNKTLTVYCAQFRPVKLKIVFIVMQICV